MLEVTQVRLRVAESRKGRLAWEGSSWRPAGLGSRKSEVVLGLTEKNPAAKRSVVSGESEHRCRRSFEGRNTFRCGPFAAHGAQFCNWPARLFMPNDVLF